jgi:hypothetical protein
MYQFVKLSINLTIGFAASLSLYSSNHVQTSFANSFNSEINHLSRLFFSFIFSIPFGEKLSIFA